VKILKCWFPFIFWIFLIFGLSSIPNISPEGIKLPSGSDKVIHYFEYSILALLFYRSLVYNRRSIGNLIAVVVVIAGSSVALMDEFYQSFIPGRDSSFFDLVADFSGVITGTVIYYFIRRHMKKRRKEL
jgi:VanZ family protein